ncbi:HNH endonuclease [Lysinibacillus sp. OTC-L20]|uniref:HNH endonuclease n=1 Tax=Lysinibacillus sp. OTC-L20 TaxID=3342791 RepID=UPI0035BA042A
MYKVQWTEDLRNNLKKYDDFSKKFLEYVNNEPLFINQSLRDLEELKNKLRMETHDEEEKIFLQIILGTDAHKYLLKLKYLNEDFLRDYIDVTQNYKNLIDGSWSIPTDYQPPIDLKDTFTYFYTNLIKSKKFNEKFLSTTAIEIENLRRHMTLKSTCPYCDIYRFEFDLSSVDHFVPKAKYPLLSIFPINLVVACTACNDRIKKENIHFPIVHPYFDNVVENFYFEYSEDDKMLNINFPSSLSAIDKKKTENFLELFEIEDRYKENYKDVYDDLIDDIQGRVLAGLRMVKKRDIRDIEIEFIEDSVEEILNESIESTQKVRSIKGLTKVKLDLLEQISNSEVKNLSNYLYVEINNKQIRSTSNVI